MGKAIATYCVVLVIYFPVVMGEAQSKCTLTTGTIPPKKDLIVFSGSHYRIPSIVASNGILVAFAEKRKSAADPGKVGENGELVSKFSSDCGNTWSAETVIASDIQYDYSDPRVGVEKDTGTLILVYTRWGDGCGQSCASYGDKDNKLVYRVGFDGILWGNERIIDIKQPWMQSINSGPGAILQTATGRLMFPIVSRNAENQYISSIVYSDDQGGTWHIGSRLPGNGATEGDAVQLPNGEIILTARNDGPELVTRLFFSSNDDGQTWNRYTVNNLDVPRVDASLLAIGDTVYLSSPIGKERMIITLWKSTDNGLTFEPETIASGFAGYSAMAYLSNVIFLLYESEVSTEISLIRIPIK